MKSAYLKPAVVGATVGLALGLIFVISIHTGLDSLWPILIWPSIPCWYVAQMFGSHLPGSLEWLAWTAGVLTMGLIGATLGLATRGAYSLIRRPV